MMTNFKILIRT